jgi:hypothetical protein
MNESGKLSSDSLEDQKLLTDKSTTTLYVSQGGAVSQGEAAFCNKKCVQKGSYDSKNSESSSNKIASDLAMSCEFRLDTSMALES